MTAAQVINFPKQHTPQPKQEAGSMYSDKFTQGYVMSSRLYRAEVFPFLSDAARNVYAELENRINGHNKESDFVSYSQLQGGALAGSRKMGRTTVSNALQELIKLGVITVISCGKQGTKSYRLNDVSLKDRFTNKTSPITGLVQQQDQDQSTNKTETSTATGLTIDNKNILEDDDNEREDFQPQQNRPLNFVEYHPKDRTAISFKDLCKKYSAQIDFQDQAKINFPNHAPERIFENLKKMAQWSLDKSNHTPQKWMTIWLDTFMKNMPSDAELAAQQARKAKSTPKTKPQKKYHRYGQAQYQQPAMRDVGGNHE
ncbi:helix-turn-helix domain-containing protein [Acinetobacter towneri]|uniref:helix-turn-helix domain-containing protein n=1 Tax=Acinetobacter towneri TaxID=202956 RepID=UPI001F442868|nr:helix-turn-helix domain-containing protein [Acinetobacter towneri]UIP24539.1 helix-turn-helix domain-containing protein [Acinetobacter towneri]